MKLLRAEDDVLGACGRQGDLPSAFEGEGLVAQRREEFDDAGAVAAARLDEHRGAEAFEQRAQFGQHHHFVAFDVAFDEVEAFESGEEFAAPAHLGRELRGGGRAAVVDEVLSRAEVARFARRVVGHRDRFVLGAQRVGEYLDVAAAAQVAAQDGEDRGNRLHGIDPARRAGQPGERAGVVAEVGADVDGRVARADELRQVVDVFGGGGVTPDAEPLPEEEQAAHGAQVAFERQGSVEDFMDQCLHVSGGLRSGFSRTASAAVSRRGLSSCSSLLG